MYVIPHSIEYRGLDTANAGSLCRPMQELYKYRKSMQTYAGAELEVFISHTSVLYASVLETIKGVSSVYICVDPRK